MALFGEALAKTTSGATSFAGGFLEGAAAGAAGAVEGALGIDIFGGSAESAALTIAQTSWGNLNPLLLARVQPCDPRTGKILEGYFPVICPINEFTMSGSFNWQSPFESAGAESKAPALMALIQSGQTSVYLNALRGALGDLNAQFGGGGGATESVISGANTLAVGAQQTANELVGRTGITKLNSRQVFAGSAPLEMSGNFHFRAIQDAVQEVLIPYWSLWDWAMPQELAADGALAAIFDEVKGGGSFMKGLFPSQSPQTVAFTYGGETIAPLVIETMSAPLDSPKDTDGNTLHKVVNITLSSLTSLDKNDVTAFFQ
jgi:hypothetical protein